MPREKDTPSNLGETQNPDTPITQEENPRVIEGVKARVHQTQEATIPTTKNLPLHTEGLKSEHIKIHLLRHYSYIDDGIIGGHYAEYKRLLAKKYSSGLNEEEENQIREHEEWCNIYPHLSDTPESLQGTIQKLFQNPSRTLLIFDGNTDTSWKLCNPRAEITGKNLAKVFWVPENHIISDAELPASDKTETPSQKTAKTSGNFDKLMKKLRLMDLSEIDDIIIVANRSYAEVFNSDHNQWQLDKEESNTFLEQYGYLSYEVDRTNGLHPLPESCKQMKSKVEAFQKANSIQNNSLERKLYRDRSWSTLERKVYFMEEDKQQENQPSWSQDWKEKKYHKRYVPLNKLFDTDLPTQEGKTGRKFVLPAHVGNGKSFIMAEVVKKLVRDVNKKIIFFEGKDFSEKYPQEEIENIFEEAKKSGTIICIDAIDEISYDPHKQLIKEQLQSTDISCFITARKTEYADENPGFTTLHLDPMDMEEFLQSRFSDEKKREEVQTKLKSMNLYAEIQWNPLLLSFVSILASLDETKRGEYKKFWIKNIEDIQNRTDLYESISRMILVKHNEQKEINLWEDEIDMAMEKLWKSAHDFFTWKNLKISDRYLQKLSFFKKSDKWEYQFIHESFQEFFLARHFASLSNGNKEIYKVRNENEQDWKKWREFKPVVLFYGEELARNGKLEELEWLLNWLLANDDMFGEVFFMGLEILYKLKGNEEIKKKYLEKIKDWNKEELLYGLWSFQEFQKSIGYGENKFADDFFDWLAEKFWGDFFNENIREIIKLWNRKAIQWALDYIYNFDEDWHNDFPTEDTYMAFIDTGNQMAIDWILGVLQKLEKEDITRARNIYNILISTRNEQVINQALCFAQETEDLGDMKRWWSLYMNLMIHGNQYTEKLVLSTTKKLANKKDFKELMSIFFQSESNPKIAEQIFNFIETFKEDRDVLLDCINWSVFLVNRWFLGAMDNVLYFARKLEDNWYWEQAYRVYDRIIEWWISPLKESIENRLNETFINQVSDFFQKFKKQLKNWSFWDIYLKLIPTWNPRVLKWTLNLAHKHEQDRDLYGACDLYIKLIPTWDPLAIEKISSCFYEYLKEENKDRWSNSSNSTHLCEKLVATWNGEVIKQVLYFIEKLKEDEEITPNLYGKLFCILNPKSWEQPLQQWDTEGINQFLQFIKKREDELYATIDKQKRPYNPEEDYSEDFWGYSVSERDLCYSFYMILNSYIELIDIWNQEAIRWARELIRKSIQVWELDVTIELAERLKEVTKKIPM